MVNRCGVLDEFDEKGKADYTVPLMTVGTLRPGNRIFFTQSLVTHEQRQPRRDRLSYRQPSNAAWYMYMHVYKESIAHIVVLLKHLTFCFVKEFYCWTAHDGWEIIGHQGMFCPLTKLFCDRLPGGLQLH